MIDVLGWVAILLLIGLSVAISVRVSILSKRIDVVHRRITLALKQAGLDDRWED